MSVRGDLVAWQSQNTEIESRGECKVKERGAGRTAHGWSSSKDLNLPANPVLLHFMICHSRERENYAEKGRNPFLHMLRERTLT